MTERVLGPTGSRRRRRRLLATTALIGALLTIFFVAASSATLANSTFDTGNGTLTDTTDNDWNPPGSPTGNVGPVEPIDCVAPGLSNCGLDLVNSSSDNAYGQGAKEDDPSPSVVTGSIPPQKDDLSRFYVNKQRRNSKDFLYLAWERSNLLGSAHMDFEFNQKFCDLSTTPTNCAANNVNPLRTAGDLLVDFDFGGSGQVGLFLHKWITTGSSSLCEASNTVPCWDKAVTLTNAEASVNKVDVTDNNPPGNPRNLDGEEKKTGQDTTVSSEFGEAGINLTDSSVFPQNVCVNFGSASLKSRSSGSSFTSELKDFIAPIPVSISNCGAIKIIKRTDPRGVNKDFSFTSTIPNPAQGSSQPTCTTDTTPDAFTLNDNLNTSADSTGNTESCVNVLGGSYTVTETLPVAGFVLDSIGCSKSPANGTSSWTTDKATGVASITLVAGEVVTCVYTNKQQRGAIKITKSSTKGNSALAGAKFSIKDPNGTALTGSPFTTDTNGVICKDGLAFGDYKVKETEAPGGYKIDDSTEYTLTVNTNATCSDSTFVGASKSFTDTPVGEVRVIFTNTSGVMTSQIVCKEGSTVIPATKTDGTADEDGNPDDTPVGTVVRDDTDETFRNLDTGVYVCTIDVDP